MLKGYDSQRILHKPHAPWHHETCKYWQSACESTCESHIAWNASCSSCSGLLQLGPSRTCAHSDAPEACAQSRLHQVQAGALPSLGALALNNIGVSGPLPSSWGRNFSLPSLQQLNLNDNPIKGDLPTALQCSEAATGWIFLSLRMTIPRFAVLLG